MSSITYSEREFQKHLKEEHKQSTFSEYIKEIIYGGSDGIITTFAVVAGFNGAQSGDSVLPYSFLTVLLFGLANLFADGVSMALGNILSIRSTKDVYKKEKEKEWNEIKNNPDMEAVETTHILQKKGFTENDAKKMTELYKKNPKYWLEFMMKDELEMSNPENINALLTGFATFVSFLLFGSLPLLPYIVFQKTDSMFHISVISSFIALILLGILRYKVTKETLFRSVIEVVFLGGAAGVVAFFVGTFFRV